MSSTSAWSLLETGAVTSYGSGWRKDVVNQCLHFVLETYGVTSYGSGWKKDVADQCLEFAWTFGVPSYDSGWRKDVFNQCLEFVFSDSVYGSGCRKDVINQCLGVCVQIPRPTPNHPSKFGTASAPPPHDSAS